MIDRHRRNVSLLVAACFFMELLDGTIVVTAAPKIADALGVSVGSVGLVVTSYLLALGALIPVGGWMTTRYGPRPVFTGAIALFTLASLGCALSTSLAMLVALRAVQGAGGALMVPVGRLVVLRDAPKSEVVRLVAYFTWPGLVAPVIAPLAGGVITTYTDWRWIFLLNVPLGVVAFAVARRLLRHEASPSQRLPLDVPGTVLTVGALAGLTVVGHVLSESGPSVAAIALTATATALLLVAASMHLLRTESPLVNLRTLRDRTFRLATTGMAVYAIPVGATPFLLPLLFQTVFGWSAVKSGAIVLFVFLGNIGIKPATTPLIERFGFRPTLITATLVLAATMGGMALFTDSTPLSVICAVAFVSGTARSTALTVYNTLAYAEVETNDMRDANTLNLVAQQVSFGLGVAAGAVALRAGEAIASTPNGAYTVAFAAMGLVALAATVGALRLERGAGDTLRVRDRATPA